MDNFHLHIIHINSSNYSLLSMELAFSFLLDCITYIDHYLNDIDNFDDIFILKAERPNYSNNDDLGYTVNTLQFRIN